MTKLNINMVIQCEGKQCGNCRWYIIYRSTDNQRHLILERRCNLFDVKLRGKRRCKKCVDNEVNE